MQPLVFMHVHKDTVLDAECVISSVGRITGAYPYYSLQWRWRLVTESMLNIIAVQTLKYITYTIYNNYYIILAFN